MSWKMWIIMYDTALYRNCHKCGFFLQLWPLPLPNCCNMSSMTVLETAEFSWREYISVLPAVAHEAFSIRTRMWFALSQSIEDFSTLIHLFEKNIIWCCPGRIRLYYRHFFQAPVTLYPQLFAHNFSRLLAFQIQVLVNSPGSAKLWYLLYLLCQ